MLGNRRKKWQWVVWALATAAGLLLGWFAMQEKDSSKPLRVLFPIGALKPDDSLLDPSNTETVYEYYLLENLAIGLLRDDVAEISGYRGLLADRWRQVDARTWEFHIRPDLKWSDGSPITLEQIRDHFLYLKTANARHLIQLSMLTNVTIDSEDLNLRFQFNVPMHKGILHELSLADATLYRVKNSVPDWRVTSGPYVPEEYKPREKLLRLRINKFCLLAATDSPSKVELFFQTNRAQLLGLFEHDDTDLFLMVGLLFKNLPRQLAANKINFIQGHPNMVHFFVLNREHRLSSDKLIREAFAALIGGAISSFKMPDFSKKDNQMIPLGFEGRLSKNTERFSDMTALKGKSIEIQFWPDIKDYQELTDAIHAEANSAGIDVQFTFVDYRSKEITVPFAKFHAFKGNQKDALGSWSFLFSGSGALAPYRDLVKDELAAIPQADEDERDRLLKQIHQKVLDEAIAVPFAMEPSRVYLADGVDVSRWNPFDMRLRLYEVRVNR